MNVNHCRENGILITHGQHSTVKNSHVWRNALSNEYGNGNGWASGLSAARNGVAYATIRTILYGRTGERAYLLMKQMRLLLKIILSTIIIQPTSISPIQPT
jgi:hypothetical protein